MARVRKVASAIATLTAIAAQPSLPPHPRLILTDGRLQTIKTNIATNTDAANLYAQLLEHADWTVTQPVVPQPAPGPSGILIAVRGCLDLMLTSTLAYKLSGNTTYLDRAVAEADNLASWSGWNPSHFLDTGEASVTMSLGYDWLYNEVNQTLRDKWYNATMVMGLEQYRTAFVNHTQFWINDNMNWNCVCSSGAFAAVLALMGDNNSPSWLWSDVMAPAMVSAPFCMKNYQVEGSWDESSGYWAYASTYNVLSFSMFTSALGNDTGFATLPGVQAGGSFPLHMTGPSGLIFDWADSWPYPTVAYGDNFSTTMGFGQWWGGRFNDSASAYYARQSALTQASTPASQTQQQWGAYVYNLLFFSPLGQWSDIAALPRCYAYMSRYLAVIRSDWHWPWDGTSDGPTAAGSALFLKGGDTGLTHQHMDLGSWMWETSGVRLVEDLGADNYNLPNYFGPTRYDYYRLNSYGHNVLSFGGGMQGQANSAPLLYLNSSGPGCQGQAAAARSRLHSTANASPVLDGFAQVNLTRAYIVPGLASVVRGWASYDGARTVVVADSIDTTAAFTAPNVTSTIHTYGQVAVAADGQSATITKTSPGGSTVTGYVTILGPAMGTACPGLTLVATAIHLPQPQYDSTGLTQLDAVTTQAADCKLLALLISDVSSVPFSGTIQPLSQWQQTGPVG